jgi:hypothetical protein
MSPISFEANGLRHFARQSGSEPLGIAGCEMGLSDQPLCAPTDASMTTDMPGLSSGKGFWMVK